MPKHILTTRFRFDEPEAPGIVKPSDSTTVHCRSPAGAFDASEKSISLCVETLCQGASDPQLDITYF